MRVVALLIALLALWFAYESAVVVTDPFGLEDESFRDRERVVRHAITLAVPGAEAFGGAGASTDLFGEKSQHGRNITYAFRLLKGFDWSGVAFPEDAAGGPLATLIAQAELHREALAEAGFQLVNSHAWGSDDRLDGLPPRIDAPDVVSRPNIHVSHSSRSGGSGHSGSGHGGYLLDLDAPSIAHHRVYLHPQSGTTVFTRMTYDQASRELRVELTYSDRTVLGVDYGDATHEFEERVDKVGN